MPKNESDVRTDRVQSVVEATAREMLNSLRRSGVIVDRDTPALHIFEAALYKVSSETLRECQRMIAVRNLTADVSELRLTLDPRD